MAAAVYTVATLLVTFSCQLCRVTGAVVSRSRQDVIRSGRPHEAHTFGDIFKRHKRQAPRTGTTCVSSCAGRPDVNYQSCLGCDIYVRCSNGILADNQPCLSGLVWDDAAKRCQSTSTTCTACTDDIEEHADRYINNMIMANGNYSQASCREMCLNDIKCQAAIIRGTNCYYSERASVHLLFEAGTISMIIRTRCPVHFRCHQGLCVNGATCDELSSGGIRCICLPTYFGDFCELPFECSNGPCLNGATCVDHPGNVATGNTATCTCLSTYTGTRCENRRHRCSENLCKKGSTCEKVGTGEIWCVCPVGSAGKYCDRSVQCSDNPCQHGGICGDVTGGVVCACTSQYIGLYCEILRETTTTTTTTTITLTNAIDQTTLPSRGFAKNAISPKKVAAGIVAAGAVAAGATAAVIYVAAATGAAVGAAGTAGVGVAATATYVIFIR